MHLECHVPASQKDRQMITVTDCHQKDRKMPNLLSLFASKCTPLFICCLTFELLNFLERWPASFNAWNLSISTWWHYIEKFTWVSILFIFFLHIGSLHSFLPVFFTFNSSVLSNLILAHIFSKSFRDSFAFQALLPALWPREQVFLSEIGIGFVLLEGMMNL